MKRDGEAGTGIIVDHAFEPRDEWWSRCRECGLSEAAHVGSVSGAGLLIAQNYRCPECVTARDFGKCAQHLPGECPR